MAASTITGTVTTGVTLTADTYTNPVTIAAGATVSGPTYGVQASDSWTVDNFGTITGGAPGDFNTNGVYLKAGGVITNEAGASIYGYDTGVNLAGASATVINAGSIVGNMGTEVVGAFGVGLFATNDVLVNTGVISSSEGYGVAIGGNGLGVQTATLENAGTITGGGGLGSVSLYGSASDLLIIDPGAVFNGAVLGGPSGSYSTIELKAGSSAGAISGLGTQYKYFYTIAIDSGAAWTVGGTTAGFNGVTIDGFNSHDRLDFTDLAYGPGGTATVNGDDLIIDGSVTIQMDSNVTGDTFQVLSDGTGGSFVEESDYTPCYCRGTRIRTPRGEVAVEALKIGDRVTTAGGKVLPIKWIGRRSYRDWLAAGNSDVQPILFKAGSIADHVPVRDLYVSPEHAMFLDGVLIPAHLLVNGISILKMSGMEEVEYFHFEFDRHVVIFADGAAAESFVDDDSRMLFHNADEYRRLYPDEPRGRYTEFCAPRVEAGYELDTLQRSVAARAVRLLPDGTAAPATAQRGHLDRATRTVVEGWAFAEANEGPVRLAIVVNGAVIGQTVANRYRADLGFGDGHCSFRFALPQSLSPDVGHRIEVRRESDWSPLTGGCVMLEPEAPYSAISMTRMSRSAVSGPSTLSASR
jgi:hypothetical protein